MPEDATTPDSLEELRARVASLECELSVLLQRITELTLELARVKDADRQLALELEVKVLRERVQAAAAEQFGPSRSERRPRPPEDKPRKEKKERARSGPTPQLKLPCVDVHHPLDEADKICVKCGGGLREMAGQAEVSELVVAVERRYRVERHHRQKYHCGGCGHIDTALGPMTRLVPGGRYDLSFALQVALDKYLDHLPLERQVRRMKRSGLVVTSQTLWDQLWALYGLLLPTLIALKVQARCADVLHVDETSWRMMGKGRSKKWWLWVVRSARAVIFELLPSRGNDAAKVALGDYAGIVVADGYGVYASLEKALEKQGGRQVGLNGEVEVLPNYLLAGCWMHARRPLFKAEKSTDVVSEALDCIGELYAVEALAKERARGDPEALLRERRVLREQRSRGLVDGLKRWRDAQRPLPKSKHAEGVRFLTNHWTTLTRFLDDPRIPLDNGPAERALRGPVVGRNNYRGVRSQRGAEVAAAFFSFFASCEVVGADPAAWLEAAVRKAMDRPGAVLLPSEFVRESAQS